MRTDYLWGIDLGGTKVEGAILDVKDGYKPIHRLRLPTESKEGYQHVLGQIQKVIHLLERESGLTASSIGIGTPGSIDPILKTLKNSNTVCLNGQPILTDLKNLLKIPVRMANDANCFVLAETILGAVPQKAPDAKVVFGIIMGTGVGGGIVVNGQVIHGRQGIGGEWGHNYLDASGGKCYCGKIGCVERLISGTGLERYYSEQSGSKKNMKDIVQSYRNADDPIAEKTMHRLFEMFGKAISVVINILDPDVIILGGGLGNIEEIYTKGVKEIDKHIFNVRMDSIFLKPALGDSAGVFGAALL